MKIQWKKLLICIVIPLAVGGLSAFLTRDDMQIFESLNQPALSPPGWLFPVVWTILYIMMGIASYLVLVSGKPNEEALQAYRAQLFFNFLWSIIFFNLEKYLLALLWLVGLWVLILLSIVRFYRISKPAGWLMIPYLLWVTFAGYLNFMIWRLNS